MDLSKCNYVLVAEDKGAKIPLVIAAAFWAPTQEAAQIIARSLRKTYVAHTKKNDMPLKAEMFKLKKYEHPKQPAKK